VNESPEIRSEISEIRLKIPEISEIRPKIPEISVLPEIPVILEIRSEIS